MMASRIALLALAALLANRSEALALSGKQRRFLRAEAARLERDKNLPRAHVASVDASADAVQEMLDAGCEMVRCKFTLAHKKAEAKLLANQLSLLVGAEVAEVLEAACQEVGAALASWHGTVQAYRSDREMRASQDRAARRRPVGRPISSPSTPRSPRPGERNKRGRGVDAAAE